MNQESPINKLSFSIMDVLTNALIAITILMLISALTIGINLDNKEKKEPGLGSANLKETKIFTPIPPDFKRPLTVMQLKLIGGNPDRVLIQIHSETSIKDSLNIIQDMTNPSDWLIMKKGAYADEWYIEMTSTSSAHFPDSLLVLTNSSFQLTCAGQFAVYNDRTSNSIRIISVREYLTRPPKIRVMGKECR